ncbi:MAG: GCN5-related N-acetyltransferase [Acidobacteriaceae bacterium]|nr:GCN5-related N-acetyltransferase [Acidobacteriaceae bacterium]
MNSDWKIRIATENDLDCILSHRRGMFQEMGFTDASVLDQVVAASRGFIEKGLSDGSYRGFLAVTENNEVVAGAGLAITDWLAHPAAPKQSRRAYILNVYTAPDYRRKGIARVLMQAVLDHCKQEGFISVWLHASEYGRPLYESMGFEAANEMKIMLKPNGLVRNE